MVGVLFQRRSLFKYVMEFLWNIKCRLGLIYGFISTFVPSHNNEWTFKIINYGILN